MSAEEDSMDTVVPISHPDRVSSIRDNHQRGRGGEALGEGARGSAPSPIQPPTIRCLWIVDLHCCYDFRRFSSHDEALTFASEHWRREHRGRQA